MRIEKWKYKDKEIDIPIFEEDEIEKNEDIVDLEKTKDLKEILENIEVENAN